MANNPGHPLLPNTDDLGPVLLQATYIMVTISLTVLILRVVARIKHRGKLAWDDYLMILAMLCSLVSAGLVTELVRAGFGKHIYNLKPEQIKKAIKISYFNNPFGFLSGIFGRVSFAVTLIILMGNFSWRRWLLYFIIFTQFFAGLFVVGGIMFGCRPIRKFWDRAVPGRCPTGAWRRVPGYVQGGFNVFADLVLALMPSLVIFKMNLSKGIKAGLIFLMGLGIFNMAAAIITVVALHNAPKNTDFTYIGVVINIWGGIQNYLVITIASIPFLRPLFTNNKAFTLVYYRSLWAKYSNKFRSPGSNQSTESDGTLRVKHGKPLESLPHVPEDRFITTTLRNAGPGMKTETMTSMTMKSDTMSSETRRSDEGFESLSTVNEGSHSDRK